MAITYFGYTDESGSGWDSGDSGYTIWNGNLVFTCPGTGLQNVEEISCYLRLDSGSGNVRLAVYSLDGATKICEGSSEVAVVGAGSWQGHIGAGNITPNPAQLTGGTSYKIAFTLDSNTVGPKYATGATAGDFIYKTVSDYTGGFPAALPGSPSEFSVYFSLRCGVEPAGTAFTREISDSLAIY